MPGPAVSIDELLAHSGWVRALARSLVRDAAAADDLVQQTWMRVLETPAELRSSSPGWLATVVRNIARDGFRRDSRRAARERTAGRAEAVPAAGELVARAEAQRRLIAAVVALDDGARSVVLLRYFEGLRPREIAARTGEKPAAVRMRLHRALAVLRERLGDDARLVILPLAAPFGGSAALPSGAANLTGGIAVSASKKTMFAAALLLVAFGGAWFLLRDEGAAAAARPDPAPLPPPAPAAPRERALPEVPSAPAPAPAAPDGTAPAAETVAAPARRRLAVQFLRFAEPRKAPEGMPDMTDREIPVPPDDAPGLGGGATVSVGGGAGMGAMYWTRWAPVPERGSVTFAVQVLDAEGRSVPGADVYRLALDRDGTRKSPTTFRGLTVLGTADETGRFVAKDQPEGDYLIAANWCWVMSSEAGLDLAGSVIVHGAPGQDAGPVVVRLPIALANYGSVSGTVLDAAGKPMRGGEVSCGLQAARTGDDGRFRMDGVAVGSRVLTASALGYIDSATTVSVVAGRTQDVSVKLEYAVRGTLDVRGRVVDESGAPCPGLDVFFDGTGEQGDLDRSRWTRTAADGTFVFDRIPDAFTKERFHLMVPPMRSNEGFLWMRKENLVHTPEEIVLAVRRTYPVDVWFRDAETGAPIALHNLEARFEPPGEAPLDITTLSHYDPAGHATLNVPSGRLAMHAEGRGYRAMEIAVEIPAAGASGASASEGPLEFVIEMVRE